jgi:hypothetical protein
MIGWLGTLTPWHGTSLLPGTPPSGSGGSMSTVFLVWLRVILGSLLMLLMGYWSAGVDRICLLPTSGLRCTKLYDRLSIWVGMLMSGVATTERLHFEFHIWSGSGLDWSNEKPCDIITLWNKTDAFKIQMLDCELWSELILIFIWKKVLPIYTVTNSRKSQLALLSIRAMQYIVWWYFKIIKEQCIVPKVLLVGSF